MFISAADSLAVITFAGELRGGLSGRLRYDLFLQIDPFASDQELVTS
jgi:hypothetical protein